MLYLKSTFVRKTYTNIFIHNSQNKDASSISPECLNDLKCGLQSLLKRWQVDLIGKVSNQETVIIYIKKLAYE
jgi:hypothetical protein